MFFRKQCWHLVSESDGCTEIPLVKPAYFYHKLFWSMWCPKISSSRSLCKGLVLYIKKSMALIHIKNFSCQVTFKRKLQHVGHKCMGHMWVTSDDPDCSVGQRVKWVNRYNPLSTLMCKSLWRPDLS